MKILCSGALSALYRFRFLSTTFFLYDPQDLERNKIAVPNAVVGELCL